MMNVNLRYPTAKLFQNKFKSLPYLLQEELLILIYKVIHDLIKNKYEPTQNSSIHSYDTRRRSQYNVEFFRSGMGENNVIYKGLLEYNKIPSDIRNSITLKDFNNDLKIYLQNNEFIEF